MNNKKSHSNDLISGIIILVVAGFIIWGIVPIINGNRSDKWSLIYINDFNASTVGGIYETKQECSYSLQKAKNDGLNRPECGSNCKLSSEITDMYVCDETFDYY